MWKFETPSSFSKRQFTPTATSNSNTINKALNGSKSSKSNSEYSIEYKPDINNLNVNNTSVNGNNAAPMSQEAQKIISLYKLNYTLCGFKYFKESYRKL